MEELVIVKLSDLEQLVKRAVREALAERETPVQERYLDSNAVRKLFNPVISRSTLFNYEKKGIFTACRVNGKKLFKLSEVKAKIETIVPYSHFKIA